MKKNERKLAFLFCARNRNSEKGIHVLPVFVYLIQIDVWYKKEWREKKGVSQQNRCDV